MGILVENRSPTKDFLSFLHQVSDTSPHGGSIIDTQGMSAGLTFVPTSFDLAGGENYTFVINESDDSAMSGATPIDAKRLVGSLSDITFTTSVSTEGDFLNVIGVFNTKRFVQIVGTSTNGTQGDVWVFLRSIDENQAVVNEV